MRERLRARSAAATAAAAAEATAWRSLDALKEVARDEAWAAVGTPIRERCRVAGAEELAAEAREWMPMLAVRTRTLADDLRDLDEHRHVLFLQLRDLGLAQLTRLREVTRASRLPDGLGGLTGHPAFKISFERAPEAEAEARLLARVDEWAVGLADGRRVDRAQRVRWLTDATRDLVRVRDRSGAWRVEVLKPPVDETVEYRSPDRVRVEYSGGQELTLAVLLYCTLARVRANHRSGRPRPPGPLLIDNPFGRASNPALIRMQQSLAAAAGVQLVCATGLDDPAVLHAFDGDSGRVLRLRNDRDQRLGLQYLRVEDPGAAARIGAAVTGGRDPADPRGYLDAVGYSVRDPS
jgi:hypothetical protein